MLVCEGKQWDPQFTLNSSYVYHWVCLSFITGNEPQLLDSSVSINNLREISEDPRWIFLDLELLSNLLDSFEFADERLPLLPPRLSDRWKEVSKSAKRSPDGREMSLLHKRHSLQGINHGKQCTELASSSKHFALTVRFESPDFSCVFCYASSPGALEYAEHVFDRWFGLSLLKTTRKWNKFHWTV